MDHLVGGIDGDVSCFGHKAQGFALELSFECGGAEGFAWEFGTAKGRAVDGKVDPWFSKALADDFVFQVAEVEPFASVRKTGEDKEPGFAHGGVEVVPGWIVECHAQYRGIVCIDPVGEFLCSRGKECGV